jgi:flagellar hook-basal body complex protein FliE
MNNLSMLQPIGSPLGTLRIAPEARVPTEIPLPELQTVPLALPTGETGRTTAPASFGDVLSHLVGEVNDRQLAAADKVQGLLGGREVSLHETMIAMEEASLSFQLMVEVRNKLLESYQELMRMQV